MNQRVKSTKKGAVGTKSITVRLVDEVYLKLHDIAHSRAISEGRAWSSNAVVIDLIEAEHKRIAPKQRPKRAANG